MDTFWHKSAKFSLYAPALVVAIALGFMLITVNASPESSRSGMYVIGAINVILICTGFLLGVLSLFGMPKHGTKGILIKAFFGITFNGFFVSVFVFEVVPPLLL